MKQNVQVSNNVGKQSFSKFEWTLPWEARVGITLDPDFINTWLTRDKDTSLKYLKEYIPY